jgi:hypothetical protein
VFKFADEVSKNNNLVEAGGALIPKLNEPKIPNYITKMKGQEFCIRNLEERIQNAERTIEFNRERAAEMESSKEKFFTSWSRAVKTLELIRQSGAILDTSISEVIDIHRAALRKHGNSSIYAPGLANLNPNVQKTSYFLHNRSEDQTWLGKERGTFLQQRGWGRNQGYYHNSVFSNGRSSSFFDNEQDLGENSTGEDNSVHFVVEDMLSSLEL